LSAAFVSSHSVVYLNFGWHGERVLNSPVSRDYDCCCASSALLKAANALASLDAKAPRVIVTHSHDQQPHQPSLQVVARALQEGLQCTAGLNAALKVMSKAKKWNCKQVEIWQSTFPAASCLRQKAHQRKVAFEKAEGQWMSNNVCQWQKTSMRCVHK